MGNFDRVFDIVVGHEGGFTANPADCGNWTGGVIGTGTCRGTRFGISAAAYPDLDIANILIRQNARGMSVGEGRESADIS
jgi:lysozyme family protein